MQNWLVVMAKAPQLGRVKTRLSKDIGAVEALRFYRCNMARLLRDVGSDPRWQTVIAGAPDAELNVDAHWPTSLPRVSQGEGDLGDRMGGLMEDMPRGPVVLIGCDIPGINAEKINQAFTALGNHDAVFGPAEDGGYWLVGQKRRPAIVPMFQNVRWSTEHALNDTRANLQGRSVALLDELPDIDTGADYEKWRQSHGR